MGTPVGTGMDENKVVELSNGDVMLNSRDSSGGGYRKVAVSHDGGQTYSTPVADTQLPDPTNNASITRMYPDAAEGSADAKKLLFSNAGSKTSRSNGTIRFSCDDGVSWTSSRVFQPGSMSYSTLTPLGGGNFGLFYEGPNGKLIFASFDTAWLNASCAAVTASPATIANGATASASITVANRGTTDLPAGSITLNAPAGWTASTASVPAVPAGGTTTVSISLTAPSSAAATPAGKPLIVGVVLSAGSTSVVGQLALTVTGNGAASPVAGAQIYGQRNDAGRDLSAQPYQAGEAVPYEFHVYSTGNLTEAVVPTAGNFAPFLPPGAGNCRYLSLPVYSDYLCLTPKHTVTAAEVAQGYFIPDTTWTVSAPGAATATLHVVGSPVSLVNRQPALSAAGGSSSFTDADGNGKTSVGDTVRRAFTVANTGNVPLASLQASSDAGMPVSCDSSTLLPGASTECSIVDTLTLDNLHKDKTLPAVEASFSAANADLTATATAVAPAYRIKPGRI
jgi:sialidase-1